MAVSKRMKRIPTRSVFCDVDNTLIHWKNDSCFNEGLAFPVDFMNYNVIVSPNDSNINTVKTFFNKGYEVVVWSASGKEWAELIVDKLGLSPYVDYCLSKPDHYIDDLKVEEFMLPFQRLWYKPSGCKE